MALSKEFISGRIEPLLSGTDTTNGYKLELKMCHLQSLDFHPDLASVRLQAAYSKNKQSKLLNSAGILDQVHLLSVSLNELPQLNFRSLQLLPNLEYIDASLNHITRVDGSDLSRNLCVLNLAHNRLRDVSFLSSITSLVELNLSMNDIGSISSLPTLVHLNILHLNDNKLSSLEGIQSLPYLRELHVQRNNVSSLLPLSTNSSLIYINAADNLISSVKSTVNALLPLIHLTALVLVGNPLTNDPDYVNELRRLSSLKSLDNFSSSHLHRQEKSTSYHQTTTYSSSDHHLDPHDPCEQLRERRLVMEKNIRLLQQKIRQEEKEYQDFEAFIHRNTSNQPRPYDSGEEKNSSENRPEPRYYYNNRPAFVQKDNRIRERREKANYRDITNTDEVLRLASKELAQDTFNHPVT